MWWCERGWKFYLLKFSTLLDYKGGIYIQSNIIYNFEDLRALLSNKTKRGSYYLIYDDIYFEQIDKDTVISRDVYTLARRILKPFSIIKYITFNVKEKYSTKEIYELIDILRRDTTIIVTIFNPDRKEVFLLFISNKDDSMLEHHIKTFMELEVT